MLVMIKRKGVTLQPHELTQEQFVDEVMTYPDKYGLVVPGGRTFGPDYFRAQAVDMHYREVEAAINRFDAVPWYVLRDYPMWGFGRTNRRKDE